MTVDNRRIRLQLHPLLEAVHEHGGDQRALVRSPGLPLDDGGEYQCVVWRSERQALRASFPLRRKMALHEPVGAAQYVEIARAVAEIVGVREEPALRRALLDAESLRHFDVREIAHFLRYALLGGERFSHLPERPAFDERDADEGVVARGDLAQQRERRDRPVDLVEAGLQIARLAH